MIRVAVTATTKTTLNGRRGRITIRRWDPPNPRRVVVIVHGIAEHSGRYEHVAQRFAADGAAVYAPDHFGHGHSEGERGLIDDFDDLVADLAAVIELAASEHPDLPIALVAHSLGGIVATRYVQSSPARLAALVLSGPVIGGNPAFKALLDLDPLPEVPIDPAALSRDSAVGEAYATDELIYHGPLQRRTLESIFEAVDKIAAGPELGELPLCWLHGELDPLAPLDATRPVVDWIHGPDFEAHIYPGAMHEIFNEINQAEVLDDASAFIMTRT